MPDYSDQVREHFLHPLNVSEVDEAAAIGDTGSPECGAIIRLALKIETPRQQITAAKFKATGCPFLIAAASITTEIVKGLSMGEAASLSELEISAYLGEVPSSKMHCLALCREALRAAAIYYHQATLEEWTGEEALICTCFGVSERTIEQAIHEGLLVSRDEVTRACNAGGGCGSCRPLIEEMLEDYWLVNRQS
jgi:NifU-like protein